MTTLTINLTDDQADALRAALVTDETGTVNCIPERTCPPEPDADGTVTLTADDFDENNLYRWGNSIIVENRLVINVEFWARFRGGIKAGWGIEAGGGIEAGWGIEAGEGIEAGGGITAGEGIKAGGGITAGWGIKAGEGITAGEGIEAGEGIKAGGGITAGEGIEAGGGITAGWGIEAGGGIEAGEGYGLFAGVSVYLKSPPKTITCKHHDRGEVRYGDLVLIPGGSDA